MIAPTSTIEELIKREARESGIDIGRIDVEATRGLFLTGTATGVLQMAGVMSEFDDPILYVPRIQNLVRASFAYMEALREAATIQRNRAIAAKRRREKALKPGGAK